MSRLIAIFSELYCRSEEKGKTVSVLMNEDFSSKEKLTLSSQFVNAEDLSVRVDDGSDVKKTSKGEKFGEVSSSSRIFINSNLSLNSLL